MLVIKRAGGCLPIPTLFLFVIRYDTTSRRDVTLSLSALVTIPASLYPISNI